VNTRPGLTLIAVDSFFVCAVFFEYIAFLIIYWLVPSIVLEIGSLTIGIFKVIIFCGSLWVCIMKYLTVMLFLYSHSI